MPPAPFPMPLPSDLSLATEVEVNDGAGIGAAASLPPIHNLKFGRYEVLHRPDGTLHELGRGAMGVTYKTFDSKLRRTVALKVINAALLGDDASAKQRFLREASAAAQLHHPHIATVFDIGEEGGDDFYVMEFIEGEDLLSRCRRVGTMNATLGLQITHQVAQALGEAWRQRIVHRDIKPANLMLVCRTPGEHAESKPVVKVVDFGLAKAIGASVEGSASISRAMGFVGTAAYASPEQIEGSELDIRSDLYSLGVTFWHLLAGQPTFGNTSVQQAITGHLAKPPPFSVLRAAGTPEAVVALLGKLLEKNPANRPAVPEIVLEEIERIERRMENGCSDERRSPAIGARTKSPIKETFPPAPVLVAEATSADYSEITPLRLVPAAAFQLVEVMRHRGSLKAGEISLLLKAFSFLLDENRRAGGGLIGEPTVETVQVQFAPAPTDLVRLPKVSLEEWPAFTLAIQPTATDEPTATSSLERTSLAAVRPVETIGFARQIAALIYELLSGAVPRIPFAPLSALNEEGNVVLRQALTAPGYDGADEFIHALQRSLDLNALPLQIKATPMKRYSAPAISLLPPPRPSAAPLPLKAESALRAYVKEHFPSVLAFIGKLLVALLFSSGLAKEIVWLKGANYEEYDDDWTPPQRTHAKVMPVFPDTTPDTPASLPTRNPTPQTTMAAAHLPR